MPGFCLVLPGFARFASFVRFRPNLPEFFSFRSSCACAVHYPLLWSHGSPSILQVVLLVVVMVVVVGVVVMVVLVVVVAGFAVLVEVGVQLGI